jgi:aminoglycoside phosphotransferase (APT) family kinase protein
MEYRPIARDPGAYQQPVTADQIRAMCRRAFGPGVSVRSVVELGLGGYNNTYRVDLGADRHVILRVAPEPARQYLSEREFLRNEHAAEPHLAPIAALLPRTLATDFSHDIVGRDYLFQTMLPGVPAPEGLAAYPRPAWASFFRQLGVIARKIHDIVGVRFGSMTNPAHDTWSAAVITSLQVLAADIGGAGLDCTDVSAVAAAADREREVLDEITEPRLLHGDLWTVNVLVAKGGREPTICGVCDYDRSSWGDPESDWTIRMASRRPGTERDAFWETYGSVAATSGAARRALFYQARHVAAIRLERHRLRSETLQETYDEMRDILDRLAG